MPSPTKKTYLITPNGGGASSQYEVTGTKLTRDEASGRLEVFDGEELVASLLNVQVRLKTTDS